MITMLTKYKVPDETLKQAQDRANETRKTQYLAYLRAAKDEPLTLVDVEPSAGVAAVIEPEPQV